jgi:hypothetical protein
MRFDILTHYLAEATFGGSVFDHHPLLIARMDQLARSDELAAVLEHSEWDLVVVDEAHRMSAHYFGRELKTTRRYELGRMLGRVCRHLLLMTATPHAGNETDFQLFLGLLDADRFEGRYRSGAHNLDTSGLMRRMVKEELLTFQGTPLFRNGAPRPCRTFCPGWRSSCTRRSPPMCARSGTGSTRSSRRASPSAGELLLDPTAMQDREGRLRKLIVFTEHRDTLTYLVDQVGALLGRPDAVVAIHGGTGRAERRRIQRCSHRTRTRSCWWPPTPPARGSTCSAPT